MVGVPTGPSHRLHTGHCRGMGREAGRGREGSKEREGGKQGEGGSKRGRRVKREIWDVKSKYSLWNRLLIMGHRMFQTQFSYNRPDNCVTAHCCM